MKFRPNSRYVKTVLGMGVLFVAWFCAAAASKVSGTVTDLNGNPVPNSTVIVENKVSHRKISVQTDKQGRFSVQGLKGSNYSVFVIADSAQGGYRLQLDGADSAQTPDQGKHGVIAQRSLLPSHTPAKGHQLVTQ